MYRSKKTGGQGKQRALIRRLPNTCYESVDQLQADLDRYVEFYNRERAHQDYRTQGRTPYQEFLEGVDQMSQDRVA